MFPTTPWNIVGILEEIFPGKIPQEKSKSLFEFVKPYMFTGWASGSLPLTNLYSAKSALNLSFKKCSWAYCFSWIAFVAKWVNMMLVMHISQQSYQDRPEYVVVSGGTDTWARLFAYTLVFSTGMLTQLLGIVQSQNLLKALIELEEYDQHFGIQESQSFSKSKSIINAMFCIIMTIAPNLRRWITGGPKLSAQFFGLFFVSNQILLETYVALAAFSLELGIIFLFGQIFFLAEILTDRLDYFAKIVQEKRNSNTWISKSKEKSWLDLSHQYLNFHTVFAKSVKIFSVYFIALFPFMILACVCGIYFETRGITRGDFSVHLLVGIVANSYRIFALADCGEKIQKNYRQLLQILLNTNHNFLISKEEKKEYKKLLRVVTFLPITLSVGGFFTANRKNITAICGVTLTYIIVLQQLNLADEALRTEDGQPYNPKN